VVVTHSSLTDAVIASGLEVGERVVVSSIRNAIQGMALETLGLTEGETRVANREQAKAVGS
jgi:hypothetical protein